MLTTIATDLATGLAATIVRDRPSGLVDRITDVLSTRPWFEELDRAVRSGDPAESRRAAWVRAAMIQNAMSAPRFAIRVAVPDPISAGVPWPEARIVIDGRPVIATVFAGGRAQAPDELLDHGLLRATDEPREIRLTEAEHAANPDDGVFVTIVREGSEVIWRHWRSSSPGTMPDLRFDAAEYHREVARAERDHGWEWPARTVARLIDGQLRADPTILGRGDCAPTCPAVWLTRFDVMRLEFSCPAARERSRR